MNKLNKDVPEPIPAHVVASTNETANLAEEAGEMIAKVFGERSTEETGREDGEDVPWDPLPKV